MPRKFIRICSFTLLLFAILASSIFSAPVQVRAAQSNSAPEPMLVAQLYYTTRAQLDTLAKTLDIWESHPDQKMIVVMISQSQLAGLQAQGYRLVLDDAKTSMINTPRVIPLDQLNGIPGYICYRTVEETFATLTSLNTTYPDLVLLSDIGNSWDKVTGGGPTGYDIWMLRLTNENFTPPGGKFKFFLMAEIHAREYVTAEIATRFAEYLLSQYGTNPDITWLLDYAEIHIVPMTNPDGRKKAEAGQEWRKNTDNNDGCSSSYGTDLNRNSSFEWGGAGTDPCEETYQGPSAASEPETQAIQNYVSSILLDRRGTALTDPAPLDYEGLFVTLHSYSNLVLFPWGNTYDNAPNHTGLQTLARKMAYFNGYEPQKSTALYPTTGSTDDWAYGALGVPAYTYEIGDIFFQSCTTFESYIWADNRASLLYDFKAARRPYMTPAGPEVLSPVVAPASVMPSQLITLTASANDTRYNNSNGTEPTQNITAARYSIDDPSWIAGVTTYPMQATDGNFNSGAENLTASVNTAGLTPGSHTLFIEAQDAAGNWGVPSAVFFDITAPADGYAQLTPASSETSGQPGGSASHTLTLTNIGLASATFDLSVGGSPAWTTSLSTPSVVLGANESVQFDVTVDVPLSAGGGETDTAQITATPAGHPEYADTASVTTFVSQVTVSPASDSASAAPGGQAVYTLTVTSYADGWRTFDITTGTHAWPVTLSKTLIGLQPGTSTTITATVSIPAGTPEGSSEALNVRIEMRADRRHFAESTLTTTALEGFGVTLETDDADRAGLPGAQVAYTLTVTNTGSNSDTFDLGASGGSWMVNLPASVGPIAAGGSADVAVTVTIPTDALDGDSDLAVITATSQTNAAAQDTLNLTTSAEVSYGVTLGTYDADRSGLPGTQIAYTLTVTNTGTYTDTFNLSFSGGSWSVDLPASVGPIVAGGSADVVVTVTIPTDALDGDNDLVTITAASQVNAATQAALDLTTSAYSPSALLKVYLPAILN